MRASAYFPTALFAFLTACGGKVIFDTGASGAGGAFGTTTGVASTTHATSTHAATGTSAVNSGSGVVSSNAVTGASVTTGTGMSCVDPGPPPGATVGTTDCGQLPCSAASSCFEVCSALYDCGLATCGPQGAKLCPGFSGTAQQHDGFIAAMGACASACMQNPAIKNLIDPTDCTATINTFKGVAPAFSMFCQSFGG